MNLGNYPETRMRRLRQFSWSRELVAETNLSVKDLVWPIFICEDGMDTVIPSMPGVERYTLKNLSAGINLAHSLGIRAVAIFPVINASLKCEMGREATNSDNLACRAVKVIKDACPDMGVITDVALDPYTSHGHDGIIRGGDVHNDDTIRVLEECAVALARAGADVVAPSDMMDGRVGAIRRFLDGEGYHNTMILAYAAKYASGFYGPFRDALGSSSNLGKKGKHTYQMDPSNRLEAIREGMLDASEGADALMVKPGMPYLDIVRDFKEHIKMPLFVYQVSGEYAMMKAAAQNGWLDYNRVLIESMICFKRAGADAVLTYAALDVARILSE